MLTYVRFRWWSEEAEAGGYPKQLSILRQDGVGSGVEAWGEEEWGGAQRCRTRGEEEETIVNGHILQFMTF